MDSCNIWHSSKLFLIKLCYILMLKNIKQTNVLIYMHAIVFNVLLLLIYGVFMPNALKTILTENLPYVAMSKFSSVSYILMHQNLLLQCQN